MHKRIATKNLNFKGFTLAETLITLGIIGIVAAMTLPALITSYQKAETIAHLKKTYSILSQAVKRAELENGAAEYWDYSLSANDFYKLYLRPYLVYSVEYIDNRAISYKALNSNAPNQFGFTSVNTPKIVLADGTMIAVSTKTSTKSKVIYVDTNSFNKPNQLGRDIFYFTIQPKKGVLPYGFGDALNGESLGNNTDRYTILTKQHYAACNKQNQGIWCAALIFVDGWEIKKDYPW